MPFNLSIGGYEGSLVAPGPHPATIADVVPTDGQEQYLSLTFQLTDSDPVKYLKAFELIGADESSPRYGEVGKGMKFAIAAIEACGGDPANINESGDFIELMLGKQVKVMVAHARRNGVMTAIVKEVLPPDPVAEAPAKKAPARKAAAATE